MSDIIKKINEDYQDYQRFCKIAGVEPIDIRDEKCFYDHWKELKHSHKFNWIMDYCEKMGLNPAFKNVWEEGERKYKKYLEEVLK